MNFRLSLVLLSFLIMGFGDVVGTLVGFARDTFHLSGAMAGLLPLAGFLAFGLWSVPVGVLQARKGKKFVLLLGLGTALAGATLPLLSASAYTVLLLSILLLGSGMAFLQVGGNPAMRDVSSPGRYARNLSFAQFIKAIGSLSGPLLTTLVLSHWTGLFPLYAGIIALAFLGLLLTPFPHHTSQDTPTTLKTCLELLRLGRVRAMVGGIFLYVGAEVGMNAWIATYLNQHHGLDLTRMATLGIGFFFVALLCGRLLGALLLTWIPASRFFLFTVLLALAALPAFLFAPASWALAALFLLGLGFANIFPLIFSQLIDWKPEAADGLSGLMVSAIAGGAILPFFMGLMADISLQAAFGLIGLALLYLLWLAWTGSREQGGAA